MARSPVVKLAALVPFFTFAATAAAGCATEPAEDVPEIEDVGVRPATVVPGQPPNGMYIVVLKKGADANAVARAAGASPAHRYTHALNGFAAPLAPAAVAALSKRSDVVTIEPDALHQASALQPVPTGVARMGGTSGGPSYGHMNVAVIDTGILGSHPDLNVKGGANFSNGSGWNDGNGHGTHVAGTIAAKDNEIGVVGVAPGAGLWAVRVLDNRGSGWTSGIIAGIDWVTKNRATTGITVANMSLGGRKSSTSGACRTTDNVDPGDAYHTAVCGSVAAGITYVVAAGNENTDACGTAPAGYEEVITVSALADFDGLPGGLENPTSPVTSCSESKDDSFACFSNYGRCVDVMAPGVAIRSTWNNGDYNTISGTSMASPHVAGAAVRFKSANPNATPAQVLAGLTKVAAPCATNSGICDDDPDSVEQEPLVLVGAGTTAPPPPPPCTSDADCNDGDPCTADACSPTGCVHTNNGTCGACFAKGASCVTSSQCCSGSCGGKPSQRTCK